MNEIHKLAQSAHISANRFIVFAGSGLSVDAEVPTSWELMLNALRVPFLDDSEVHSRPEEIPQEELVEWYNEHEDYSEMSYPKVIKEAFPSRNDERDFLREQLGNYDYGDSHSSIAHLIEKNIVRHIVTTNFETYIEDALRDRDMEPHTVITESDIKELPPLVHSTDVRIYKPHGDLQQHHLKNTPTATNRLPFCVEEHLYELLSKYSVIVIGVNGRERSIQRLFRFRDYYHFPVYWINPSNPHPDMEEILNKNDENVFIIKETASDFFGKLFDLLSTEEMASQDSADEIVQEHQIPLDMTDDGEIEPVLTVLLEEFEKLRPEFDKRENPDEVIIEQINNASGLIYKFLDLSDGSSLRCWCKDRIPMKLN